MVFLWLRSSIYLQLLSSMLLLYWLLLSWPLLLVVKILQHHVEFNHCRSCRGGKKENNVSDTTGRQREGQCYVLPANLQFGFRFSQVPEALSIPWDTLSTRHCLSTSISALQLWAPAPEESREEARREPREDPRVLYCRSVGTVVKM